MARIPLPTDDELDDRALALLGTLPKLNVARMIARTGIAPEFYAALGKLFQEDFLAPDDREVILFRVCRNNGSTYEIAQHRAFSGFSDEWSTGSSRTALMFSISGTAAYASCATRSANRGGCRKIPSISRGALQRTERGLPGDFVMSWFNMLTRYVDSTGVPPETGDNPYGGMTGPAVGGAS